MLKLRPTSVGRTLDNALLNLGLKDQYKTGVDKLGFVRHLADLLLNDVTNFNSS
jgi:starch phosphorylase